MLSVTRFVTKTVHSTGVNHGGPVHLGNEDEGERVSLCCRGSGLTHRVQANPVWALCVGPPHGWRIVCVTIEHVQ